MREDLVSYIWRYRMWGDALLTTVTGEPVEVIDVGLPNNGAGPDYFNARCALPVRFGLAMWRFMCGLPTGSDISMRLMRLIIP